MDTRDTSLGKSSIKNCFLRRNDVVKYVKLLNISKQASSANSPVNSLFLKEYFVCMSYNIVYVPLEIFHSADRDVIRGVGLDLCMALVAVRVLYHVNTI